MLYRPNSSHSSKMTERPADKSLAASITRAASKQTYYTILYLVDRDMVTNAYQAYAYFRWFDDLLDQSGMGRADRLAFVDRQVAIADRCYQGDDPSNLTPEENLLVDLIRSDPARSSELQAYIRNMMSVMAFDADRRGQLITQRQLAEYTRCLATAVTEALHYFIGHRCSSPHDKKRYLAASAAHISHMLRDTFEDNAGGYFNIPIEYLESQGIPPQDVWSDPYRSWVKERVGIARQYFQAGKSYLAGVKNLRCRIAGYAYIARFEGVLDSIESEGYLLRPDYPERNTLGAGIRTAWSTLSLAFYANRTISPAEPAG